MTDESKSAVVIWKDASFTQENLYLEKNVARARSEAVSNVAYHLVMGIGTDQKTYEGKLTIKFDIVSEADRKNYFLNTFFLDFQGQEISNVKLDGAALKENDLEFTKHRIYFSGLVKKAGKHEISLNFKNTFVDNSAGLHHFKDPADGKIYIFSHCEPFFCHRWFPCFD